MGWKDWSYAKKGFIIGLIILSIPITIYIIGFIFFSKNCGPWCIEVYGSEFIGSLFFILATPLSILLLIPLILGAIIGWLYGKIKNKNQQSSQTPTPAQK